MEEQNSPQEKHWQIEAFYALSYLISCLLLVYSITKKTIIFRILKTTIIWLFLGYGITLTRFHVYIARAFEQIRTMLYQYGEHYSLSNIVRPSIRGFIYLGLGGILLIDQIGLLRVGSIHRVVQFGAASLSIGIIAHIALNIAPRSFLMHIYIAAITGAAVFGAFLVLVWRPF